MEVVEGAGEVGVELFFCLDEGGVGGVFLPVGAVSGGLCVGFHVDGHEADGGGDEGELADG